MTQLGYLLTSTTTSSPVPILVIGFVQLIAIAAGLAKIFQKAGQAWWKALVPIYNFWIVLEINDSNPLLTFAIFVPVIQIYVFYKILGGLAYSFGKGHGWAIALILLPWIFLPVLGFGSTEYNTNKSTAYVGP